MKKYLQRLQTVNGVSTNYLSQRELEYFKRLPTHKQYNYLAGRLLLKSLYRDHFENTCYTGIETGYRKNKPYILNNPSLHTSLSHSGKYVAVAIADSPIGIDIEVKLASDRLGGYIATPEELREASSTSMGATSHTPTLIWCAKEAAYKADSREAAPWDYTLYSEQGELFVKRKDARWSISVASGYVYQFCSAKLL